MQGTAARARPQPPPIDEAVLSEMDPATRAAALAAHFGDAPQDAVAAAAGFDDVVGPPAGGGEDIPKFDVKSSAAELQADLGVAGEHVGVLRDLTANDAPADLVADVVRRCRLMRQGVHNVIDNVSDETVLDLAVQVRRPAALLPSVELTWL